MKARQFTLAATVTLLVVTLVLGFQRLRASKDSAVDAADNLDRCHLLAQEIESLRTSPAQASLRMQSQQELASLLEQAGKSATIPEAAVASIHPESNRRIGKTAYVEQPTRVELRQVSLGHVIGFLLEVISRDPRILPTSLRLSAPRTQGGEAAETWQAEVVLTHVVFSPESGGP